MEIKKISSAAKRLNQDMGTKLEMIHLHKTGSSSESKI
jgi:hypothetical protein